MLYCWVCTDTLTQVLNHLYGNVCRHWLAFWKMGWFAFLTRVKGKDKDHSRVFMLNAKLQTAALALQTPCWRPGNLRLHSDQIKFLANLKVFSFMWMRLVCFAWVRVNHLRSKLQWLPAKNWNRLDFRRDAALRHAAAANHVKGASSSDWLPPLNCGRNRLHHRYYIYIPTCIYVYESTQLDVTQWVLLC